MLHYRTMKIVLCGHVCIDVNISEGASYTSWGSSLMYMAHYFQDQLKLAPLLIAAYGRDFEQYTKGITFLPVAMGEHTLIYKNHTTNNRRLQQCDHVADAKPVPITKAVKDSVAQADIICVAPLLPNFSTAYVRQLLSTKKFKSLAVLLPQGYLRTADHKGYVQPREFEEADEIIALFDMVIISNDDHPNAVQLAQQWARQAPQVAIIVTQGSRGASLVSADTVRPVATEPVAEEHIVDSVGCGDTFSAALMYSYFQGRDIIAAIQTGNASARAKLFRVSPPTAS